MWLRSLDEDDGGGGTIMPDQKARSIVDSLLEQSRDLEEAFDSFLDEEKAKLAGLLGQKHLVATREAAGALAKLRSTVSFILFDYAGVIINANATAAELLGLPVERVLGRQVMEFYAQEAGGSQEEFTRAVEFFWDHGYWFGKAGFVSEAGERHDLVVFTFFTEGSSDHPVIGSVGLPIENLKPFTTSDLSHHKKRYLEMAAKQRDRGRG